MRHAVPVAVTPEERARLEAWVRAGPPRGRRALRARIVLGAADGLTNEEIASRLRVHLETATRWRSRFALNGLEGVSREAPRGGSPSRVSRSTVRRIVRATLAGPPAPEPGWTTRSLARSLRVNHMLVHRVWASHGLRARGVGPAPPAHVDLAGAFVTPWARAVAFAVDPRPGGAAVPSALPELVPNPTSTPEFSGPQGRAQELVRAVAAAEAAPPTPDRAARSETALLVFLRGVERGAPRSLRLEVVFDRPLTRLGRRVGRWLAAHPRLHVFTPARPQSWSEAVGAWLRRWEPVGLDRASLALTPAFAREFLPADRPRPLPRSSWGPPWWGQTGRSRLVPPGPTGLTLAGDPEASPPKGRPEPDRPAGR